MEARIPREVFQRPHRQPYTREFDTVQELLSELKTILDDEISLHEGLKNDLAFELEQDGELTGAEYVKLQQRKYYRIHQIETLESRRIGQVAELAKAWEQTPKKLTLREIIARSPGKVGSELQGCHDALAALVQEIRELARETGGVAQARLKAIDATLAVIGEAVKMHPTYSDSDCKVFYR